jgi:hypothetical protein
VAEASAVPSHIEKQEASVLLDVRLFAGGSVKVKLTEDVQPIASVLVTV